MRISFVVFVLAFPALASAGPQRVQKQQARVEGRVLKQIENTTSREGVKQDAADRYLDRYGHLDIRRVHKVADWRLTLPPAEAIEVVEESDLAVVPEDQPPPPETEAPAEDAPTE